MRTWVIIIFRRSWKWCHSLSLTLRVQSVLYRTLFEEIRAGRIVLFFIFNPPAACIMLLEDDDNFLNSMIFIYFLFFALYEEYIYFLLFVAGL